MLRNASLTLMLLSASAATAQAVNTESGNLTGTHDGNIRVYLGVPYAAPPVGNLRWQPPQPVKRSATPLPANHLGASCMQKLSRSHLPWTEEFMVQNEASEDCLYLNVWAPPKAAKPHAVLVFIHGGGFVEGSGGIASYDGAALARRGLVVVTVNYRMGVFGHLATSQLAAESPHRSAGNYFLLDQLAALQWVHRNIAAFGGDPTHVLVAGQSAGAVSVAYLMASPLAKGLFSAAAMNSGMAFGPSGAPPTLAEATTAGDGWAAHHGSSLAALRSMKAEDLLALSDGPSQDRRPIVDGWVIPAQPDAELAHATGPDVPVIAGYNADEGFADQSHGPMTAAALRKDAEKYGPQTAEFLKLYPATNDTEAANSQRAAGHDRNFALMALWAEARSKGRTSPAYLYYFQRVPPWKAHPEFRSHHTAEVPYFFDNLGKVHRDYTADDQAVSNTAASAWVHFAQTGTPGAPWQPATGNSGPFTILDTPSSSRPELTPEKMAFWRAQLLGRP